MLIYKRENRKGYLSDETHVNPENIAYAYREITGPNTYRYVAVTIGGTVMDMDKSGYERIVAWMERQDGGFDSTNHGFSGGERL